MPTDTASPTRASNGRSQSLANIDVWRNVY